jgi:hypothetical protein
MAGFGTRMRSSDATALGFAHKVRTKHVETEVVEERGLRSGDWGRVMATLKQLQGREFDPVAYKKALDELAKLNPPGRSARAGRRDVQPPPADDEILPDLPTAGDEAVKPRRRD